jgi:hypothetical protein
MDRTIQTDHTESKNAARIDSLSVLGTFIRRSRCCRRGALPVSKHAKDDLAKESTYMASAWLRAPTILIHSFRLETISGDSFNNSSKISGSEG